MSRYQRVRIVSRSFIIRHCKTEESWDNLPYDQLIKLIRQETDPDLDMPFLKEQLDISKVKKLKLNSIYSSPSKRAVQTARAISSIINVPVRIIPELQEIRFDTIPKDIYLAGKEEIRSFLFNKTVKSYADLKIKKIFSLLDDNVLVITHGFLMRIIYSRLFNVDINSLIKNKLFTNYLSGFECMSGKGVSLLKEG